MNQQTNCPFHSSKTSAGNSKGPYSAYFEDVPERSKFAKIADRFKENLQRISFASIRNSWWVYTKKDFNGALKRVAKPGKFVWEFLNPQGVEYVTSDPAILRLVLSHFRNEEGGLFCVPDNRRVFIDGKNALVKDMYPEEMSKITDVEREVVNEMIFAAESKHIPGLRGAIVGLLGPKIVQEYRSSLDEIANGMLDQLSVSEKEALNPKCFVYEYAVAVIGKLYTGFDTTRENYQTVAKAMDLVSKRLIDLILFRPTPKNELAKYHKSLCLMREIIEQHVNSSTPSDIIIGLRKAGFTEFTIKLYLFFFYLASTETTAATLHYLLLQIGRNSSYQEIIRTEDRESIFLKKCVAEALRLNPPVFIIGRVLRHDTKLVIKNTKDQSIIWSKRLLKGRRIISWTAGGGLNQELYPNPEQFYPERFETPPVNYSWYPFSTGQHSCTGQFLAKAEMESLVSTIVNRFRITNTPLLEPIESKGVFTLHADPDGKIQMRLETL